ncbi:MAG: hypothetical protein GY800_05210 [Planctomycetes bacterium]|nr:hypothetical protein [Planctomycetota bacterium]
MRKPTVAQIKSALENSACLLGQRSSTVIEKNGFQVTPNRQYREKDSGISGEVDIYAVKAAELSEDNSGDTYETVLLIKCENNTTPMVFFTQERPSSREAPKYVELAGHPADVFENPHKNTSVPMERFLRLEGFHHNYKAKWTARQFCELKPGAGGKLDLCASHDSPHNSTENVINAVNHFSSELGNRDALSKTAKDHVRLRMIYPVLLFAGPVFECRLKGKKHNVLERAHMTLQKTVQTGPLKGTYNVDIIHEDHLAKFLKLVNKENDTIADLLARNCDLLKASSEKEFEALEEQSKLPTTYAVKWT